MSWLRGNVGVMLASWFLFAVSGSLTFPYLSQYMKMLGASPAEIGLASSLASAAAMAAILPGGVLTDVIGRRRSIVIGTWGITATQFFYAASPDWRFFAAVYVVDSTLHFYQPALVAILLDSLPPERRGGGMMLTMVLPQVPWLILPPVGGYLLDALGLEGMRLSFLISGAISAAVAAMRMKALTETVPPAELEPAEVLREIARSYAFWRPLFKLDGFTAYAIALGLALNIAAAPLQRFGVLYATEVLGLDNAYWGAVQSASTAAAIAFGAAASSAIDRLPRRTALAAGLILTASAYFLIALWAHSLALFSAVVVGALGNEVAMAVRRAVVGDRVEPENRGRAMGSSLAFEYLGATIGGAAAGYLYSASPRLSFLFSGVLITASSAYLARRTKGRGEL